jgi:hypothetical protein
MFLLKERLVCCVRCVNYRGRRLTSQLVIESASGLVFFAMSNRVIVMYDPSLGLEASSNANKRIVYFVSS